MSDPFKLLAPTNGKTTTAEVREHTQDKTMSAWRQAGIAMPDLYIVDRASLIPVPVADDGQPLTPERYAEIMKGVKPMFEASPDGDNRKAKPTCQNYLKAFDKQIVPEVCGKTAEESKPKAMRIFKPVPVDSLDAPSR